MESLVLFSIPFVTALIGWFTNKVAVRMLFHPQNPINILGFRWQGLIPRRQHEIAAQTGEIIEKEILQDHLLAASLREMDLQPHFHEFIDQLIEKSLMEKLRAMPLIGTFLNDSLVDQFTKLAKRELDSHSADLIEKVAVNIENEINVQQLVKDRINGLDLDDLERLVHRIAAKEFRRIELLGGLLGFLIGLVQLLLLLAKGYVAL
ncbi:MAG: hypothetical protein CMI18_09760 [Opitutaceae bacterium]|nr:hypothetical protein [Opitutaceae bacterium]|tara:strand:- start:1209 stop:1826 length:618 start_codon:yes stop_codon:yes gene_type:complete